MKFLNYILSIYLVALSCLPCADIEARSADNMPAGISYSHEKESHSHDKESDMCSPFCTCSCCGSLIVGYLKIADFNFEVASKSIRTKLTSYTSKFTSSFFGSIWQPPQLV